MFVFIWSFRFSFSFFFIYIDHFGALGDFVIFLKTKVKDLGLRNENITALSTKKSF